LAADSRLTANVPSNFNPSTVSLRFFAESTSTVRAAIINSKSVLVMPSVP
jgi:hypothetical protein